MEEMVFLFKQICIEKKKRTAYQKKSIEKNSIERKELYGKNSIERKELCIKYWRNESLKEKNSVLSIEVLKES